MDIGKDIFLRVIKNCQITDLVVSNLSIIKKSSVYIHEMIADFKSNIFIIVNEIDNLVCLSKYFCIP